jgi:hypothetical protein
MTTVTAPRFTRTPRREAPRTITITFDVSSEHAPALRSAVEELSYILGSRAEGSHSFAKEAAITEAVIAVGALRAAVCRQIPAGDPHYK